MANRSKNNPGLAEETAPEITETVAVEEVKDEAPKEKKSSKREDKIVKVKILVPLNVRTDPTMSGMVVDAINSGRVVRIYEEKNGFGRIGAERWINLSSDFVERV